MTPESFLLLTARNPHPSFLLSVDGRILAANDAALTALGDPGKPADGRPLHDFVTSSSADFNEALRVWSASGIATGRTLRFRAGGAEGSRRYRGEGLLVMTTSSTPEPRVLLHCVPLDPSPTPAPGGDRDARSWEERRLRALRRRTGRVGIDVPDRVVGKMEAMGNLAAGISHDFNNLLTVIKVEVELCQEHGGLPLTVRESLSAAHTAVTQAESLVNGLLAFSRRQLVQVGELDLRSLVDRAVPRIHGELGSSVELIVEQFDEPLRVFVDRAQMETVLFALVRNAHEAVEGEGRIWIRTRHETLGPAFVRENEGATEGEFAVLEVADDGIGIPPEVSERLFEPFFTTKGRGAGRGLGLAQAFGIIKALQGYLRVESTVDEGAKFTVYLPLGDFHASPGMPGKD